MVKSFWNIIWLFLLKLKSDLLTQPSNVNLGVYSRKMKTYIHIKACTNKATHGQSSATDRETAGGRGPRGASTLLAV